MVERFGRDGAAGGAGRARARTGGRAARARRARRARWAAVLVCAAVAGGWSAAPAARAQQFERARTPRHLQIESALKRGVAYLESQIDNDGVCKGEFPETNIRHGGMTALAVYAIVSATGDHTRPAVVRALRWLRRVKLRGVYAVAMRACAYASVRTDDVLPWLDRDVRWLIKAAGRNGQYTYTPLEGRTAEEYDNSNAQIAVLGVWAGASRGVEVPLAYWAAVEKHWMREQQTDGGWPYVVHDNMPRSRTYGSMTAAGLATLYVCYDMLRREQFLRCDARADHKPVRRALAWLTKNYTIRSNPRKGVNWYYYWLYSLERVGLASGRRYFAGQDWFRQGAEELVTIQKGDGSWGQGPLSNAHTAFAILFLVRGRHPVLLNKLQYKGQWNPRPRDASNLAWFVQKNFERPVAWQVVDADSPLSDWHDAPLMYLSGAGRCDLTDTQVAQLRAFVYQGGTILSESACNSATFTLAMAHVYQRMFPRYKLARLPDDHPIYTLHYRPKGVRGLWGVYNGVRLLAIHSPRELSLALQLGPRLGQRPWFELATNVYLYATDRGRLRPRGLEYWPKAKGFQVQAALRVMRLRYDGNYDPEPLAWERMTRLAGERYGVKLAVTDPRPIEQLNVQQARAAVMTGTGEFTWSASQRAAIAAFVAAGGTLIIDAAGGSRPFVRAVERELKATFPGKFIRPLASHVAAEGPAKLKGILYRSDYAAALGRRQAKIPLLWGILFNERPGVVLSRADLTAGMVGFSSYRLRGYEPDTAVAIMTNLLCQTIGYVGPQDGTKPKPKPKPEPGKPAKTPPAPAGKTPAPVPTVVTPAPATRPAAPKPPPEPTVPFDPNVPPPPIVPPDALLPTPPKAPPATRPATSARPRMTPARPAPKPTTTRPKPIRPIFVPARPPAKPATRPAKPAGPRPKPAPDPGPLVPPKPAE